MSVAVPQRYVPAEARPMADGLQLLHDVLAGTGLHRRYWLFGGVVLGIVREGGLMAHDAVDVDFALLASDAWRFEAALPALFAAGFEPMFVFPGGDRPPTSWALRRGGLKFDFMLLEVAGDRFRYKNYALHGGAPSYRVCEIPAQPLEDVRFLDRTWLKTRDHDAELTALYGNWRVPEPGWDYLDGPAIVETGPWDPTGMRWVA